MAHQFHLAELPLASRGGSHQPHVLGEVLTDFSFSLHEMVRAELDHLGDLGHLSFERTYFSLLVEKVLQQEPLRLVRREELHTVSTVERMAQHGVHLVLHTGPAHVLLDLEQRILADDEKVVALDAAALLHLPRLQLLWTQ